MIISGRKKYYSIFAVLFLSVYAIYLAQAPKYYKIPKHLDVSFAEGTHLQKFLNRYLILIEEQSGFITSSKLDELAVNNARAHLDWKFKRKMSDLDLNGDFQIEYKEVLLSMSTDRFSQYRTEEQIESLAEKYMISDYNRNGKSDVEEYNQSDALENKKRDLKRFHFLLSLDPNKDGKLTYSEAEKLLSQYFRYVDIDNDQTISQAEYEKLVNYNYNKWKKELPREQRLHWEHQFE